jgi:hypothetical protein
MGLAGRSHHTRPVARAMAEQDTCLDGDMIETRVMVSRRLPPMALVLLITLFGAWVALTVRFGRITTEATPPPSRHGPVDELTAANEATLELFGDVELARALTRHSALLPHLAITASPGSPGAA